MFINQSLLEVVKATERAVRFMKMTGNITKKQIVKIYVRELYIHPSIHLSYIIGCSKVPNLGVLVFIYNPNDKTRR